MQANLFDGSPQRHSPGRAKPGPHPVWLPILIILLILQILSKNLRSPPARRARLRETSPEARELLDCKNFMHNSH